MFLGLIASFLLRVTDSGNNCSESFQHHSDTEENVYLNNKHTWILISWQLGYCVNDTIQFQAQISCWTKKQVKIDKNLRGKDIYIL